MCMRTGTVWAVLVLTAGVLASASGIRSIAPSHVADGRLPNGQLVDARYGPLVDGHSESAFDGSVPVPSGVAGPNQRTGSVQAGTVASPGERFALTYLDAQHYHSQGYQVATNSGEDYAHFVWAERWAPQADIEGQRLPQCVSYVTYDRIQGVFFTDPFYGDCIGGGSIMSPPPQEFPGLAVGAGNLAHVVHNQWRHWSTPPRQLTYDYFPAEGSDFSFPSFLDSEPYSTEALWPRVDIQQNDPANGQSGNDIWHVLAHEPFSDSSRNLLLYWRWHDTTWWLGPILVDSTATLGYVLAADAGSDNTAIVLHSAHASDGHNGLRNVAVYESQTEGMGWLDGSELGPSHKRFITAYDDALGPEAWVHISCAYDHDGVLHVVWDEQRYAGATAQVVLRHWNNVRQTIRPVAYAYWDNPVPNGGYDLNLAKITLGIGDGSTTCTEDPGAGTNRNSLYVLYTQFGGPTPQEQADYSEAGYMNGELYLAVSPDGGSHWSTPQNLTNTKTPGCRPELPDSVCASEHWATIARTVDDIHISYIRDFDAGGAPLGEGSWTINDVMYLNLPGGSDDDPYLCPATLVTCACMCHGDPRCDGQIDVFDVVTAVGVAFREAPAQGDPHDLCPQTPTDSDCSGETNIMDVVRFVNVAYRNEPAIANFCNPCP